MTASFSPERSAAMRDALVLEVAARRPRRRLLWMVGLVLAGALGGAGVSTAAFAVTGGFARTPASPAGQPSPDLGAAVVPPAGTIPGAPLISLRGKPLNAMVSAAREFSLADRPEGTTHVRVTVTALAPGGLNWGVDADGNNPHGTFSQADIDTERATTWYDQPLDASTGTLYITATEGMSASVSIQYLTYVPTHLATNADGQTYGVEGGPDGVPDLISVIGTAPDGEQVEGYAFSTELSAFSPEHAEQPSDPEEALTWQEERAKEYPNGWDVPVYESDGKTRIGTFHIQ